MPELQSKLEVEDWCVCWRNKLFTGYICRTGLPQTCVTHRQNKTVSFWLGTVVYKVAGKRCRRICVKCSSPSFIVSVISGPEILSSLRSKCDVSKRKQFNNRQISTLLHVTLSWTCWFFLKQFFIKTFLYSNYMCETFFLTLRAQHLSNTGVCCSSLSFLMRT